MILIKLWTLLMRGAEILAPMGSRQWVKNLLSLADSQEARIPETMTLLLAVCSSVNLWGCEYV